MFALFKTTNMLLVANSMIGLSENTKCLNNCFGFRHQIKVE
jgi:hypothetical protein